MPETIHIDKSGTLPRAKVTSPKAIQAWGNARESFARVIIGGAVLVILAIGYLIALSYKMPESDKILLVLGSGLGFVLGRGGRSQAGEE